MDDCLPPTGEELDKVIGGVGGRHFYHSPSLIVYYLLSTVLFFI